MYGCFVSSIDGNAITYDSASGVHETGKTLSDVKHLGIRYSKFDLMPQRLDRLFNLSSLLIQLSNMTKLVKDDFIGLENLEYLHLGNNLIRHLSSDVFWKIPLLKTLTLRDNLIVELPRDLFEYNLKLEGLYLANNQIKYINPTVFDNLPDFYYAEFLGVNHKCLTKYYSGLEEIATLKQDVKQCSNPNDLPITPEEIFGVMEECKISKRVFVLLAKDIQAKTNSSELENIIDTKKKCFKMGQYFFSAFFSV